MHLIDNAIIILVLMSMLIGLYRGFVPEVLSLVTWGVAVWVAWHFAPALEPRLAEHIPSSPLSTWAARVFLFVGALIAGGITSQLVSMAVKKTGLSGTDRVLGLVFGFFRGLFVFGVFVIFADVFRFAEEPWWQESALLPYGEGIAGILLDVLPAEIAEHLEVQEPGEQTL